MRRFARLAHDRRGVTALEFAFVAPPFLLMIMGIFDLGHIMYVKSMLQGAVEKAGRDSTLQTANSAAIDASVKAAVNVPLPGVTPVYSRKAYQDFANIGKPEPFVDGNNDKTRNPGECYSDVNGNGTWDTDSGRSNNQGGASQVAVYTVTVTYPHWFPMPGLIALVTRQPQDTSDVRLSASTVLRNQPYAKSVTTRIICT